MAQGMPITVPAVGQKESVAQTLSIPWYISCSVIAITSTTAGLYWDISWHTSVGRDTFWTPAHLAIQFGAILTGLSCAYLILSTTFGRNSAAKQSSVRLWSFRGPLGAFISAWGGFAMLTSAPFDDWWHNAFGLDVKILSPPHVLLVAGVFMMGLGGLILIVARMNRLSGMPRQKLSRLFLYAGSLLVCLLLMLTYEYTDPTHMHSAIFYRVVALAIPVALAGMARASGQRWAATKVMGIYTVLWLGALWLVPLVPAEAKLGPVYTPIAHLIPLRFPLLLIVAAAVMDWSFERFARRNTNLLAAVAGSAFLAAVIAVQWPLANFLISDHAKNWIFGTHYYPYMLHPNQYAGYAHKFTPYERTRAGLWSGIGIAIVVSIISTRLGLAWGDWMRRIRR